MAKGKSNVVSHPQVNDIDMFGANIPKSKKITWVKMYTGMDHKEAQKAVSTMESYSGSGYHSIHNGSDQAANDLINKVIDSPKTPVYSGKQYRGIHVSLGFAKNKGAGSVQEYLDTIVQSGVWSEQGATSFSTTKKTAMSFGNFGYSDKDNVSVLVTYKGGKTGMPFKHISKLSSENEVLHSQTDMMKGKKITKAYWNKSKTELFIDVDD